MRRLSLALALALLASTLLGISSAFAADPIIPSPVSGIEISPGFNCGTYLGEPVTCGATFVGAGTIDGPKDLKWTLSVTIRYSGTAVEEDNAILGGTWWLKVYEKKGGSYRHYGTIYGTVGPGLVDWPQYRTAYPGLELSGNMAVIAARMNVSYATGAYSGLSTLYFAGILDHNAWDAGTGLPTVAGYLTTTPLVVP